MKATRTVPARPVNEGSTVAGKLIDLVAETLDRSPDLDGGLIRNELAAATAALALLASGGHLRRGELVLIAPGLRLQIDVPVGERALTAVENSDPARGGAQADDWTLHVPVPDSLVAIVQAAARACPHLSTELAPEEAPETVTKSLAQTIDLARLADSGGGL